MVRLNPEPHRRVFLKPFRGIRCRSSAPAATRCTWTCRLNSYRWVRGFNEYDQLQASGVSGQGARSFYYPQLRLIVCADCHIAISAIEGRRQY